MRKRGGNFEVNRQNGNGHHKIFLFDEFEVETEIQALRRSGTDIHIATRPFQVLYFLIENRDRIVSRDELLNKFWDGRDVYDDALRKCVGAIRKALDDTEKAPHYIETRRGTGYRFVGKVLDEEAQATEMSEITPVGIYDGHQSSKGNGHISRRGLLSADDKTRQPLFRSRRLYLVISALALVLLTTLGFAIYYRQTTRVGSAGISLEKRSIAILPVRNLTGDPANDYLADGITEGLINEISRIELLKVISRSSVFQFKNNDASAEEIGRRLGVETILEGALRKNDEYLSVEARLVNTKDGSVIWASDSKQRRMADIFTIEDGITCQIVTELRVKLCGEVPPAARYTQNVEAYQLYLKGLYFRNRLGADDLKKAVDFFDQALKIDPNYALAHEGLALTYTVMEMNAIVPPGTVAPLAESHAARALELDSSLAGAYLALGAVRTLNNYDFAERERYYRQALLKNPNYRTAYLWLANNYTAQGKFEDAEREILHAQEIDPLSLGVQLTLAELYWYWNKPDKTIVQANLMLIANPENGGAYSLLARSYAQKNDFEKAFATLEKIPEDHLIRVLILAAAGRIDDAKVSADAFARSEEAKNSPFKLAGVYSLIGDKDAAFEQLERSYKMRQADLVSIRIDPSLDSLRGDPRYLDLLARVHLQ